MRETASKDLRLRCNVSGTQLERMMVCGTEEYEGRLSSDILYASKLYCTCRYYLHRYLS